MDNLELVPAGAPELVQGIVRDIVRLLPADIAGGPQWQAVVGATANAPDTWGSTIAYGERVMAWAKHLLADPAVLAVLPEHHRDAWMAGVDGHTGQAHAAKNAIEGGDQENSTLRLLAKAMWVWAECRVAHAAFRGGGVVAMDILRYLVQALPGQEIAGFWERAQPVDFLKLLILPEGADSQA